MRKVLVELILLAIAVGLTVEIIKPLIPYLPVIWLAILIHYTWEAITRDAVMGRARIIKAGLSRRGVVYSYIVIGAAGALLFVFYWWGLNKILGPKISAYEAEQHQNAMEAQPRSEPRAISGASSEKEPKAAPEDEPGPGPATGMSDSVSTLVTPVTPTGGAMIGSFQSTGRGEYEVDILRVTPEELSFTPPGRALQRGELPAKLLVNGHSLTISKFTDRGFVINDNGWRDIRIQVALIKAAPSGKPKEDVRPPNQQRPEPQEPAVPVAASLPDVTLRFVYPKSPALLLVNSPKALARDIKWTVILWNMDLPDRMDPLPIPVSTFDWLRAGDNGGPQNLFDSSLVVPLLKQGNRLFGSAAVMCPNCGRGHTYIVYIVWGEGGWFYEIKNETSGHALIPRKLTKETMEGYFRELESGAPGADRIPIADFP